MRTIGFVVLSVVIAASTAHAQFVVSDPQNLAQAILIARRTLQEYTTLLEQYHTVVRMSQGLGPLDSYRIPPIAFNGPDATGRLYGTPWIQGLNHGDPYGDLYYRTTRSLEKPGALLEPLSAVARKAVENSYATIEMTDSVAVIGAHQVALTRGYSQQLQDAVQALERDVTNPRTEYHQVTALLDKVAAGDLIGRRQDMVTNQLLSHALEQLLVRGKRTRDTEAVNMNMRLLGMRDGRAAGASVVKGASDDLRTWRQP